MHTCTTRGRRPQLAVALLVGLAGMAMPPSGRAATPPQLTVSSTWEVFHDSDNLCEGKTVHIDSPMRAFKDQSGLIHMTTADPNGKAWQWTGSVAEFNAKTAALDCAAVMEGYSGNNQIDRFDQKTFLQGFYFDPDTAYVYGYGHEDYFATRIDDPDCHKGGVDDGKPLCWYSAVAIWKADALNTSPEGHLSFVKYNSVPWHIAIYPHVVYPGDVNTPRSGTEEAGWIGYGTPSNLVRGRNPDGSLNGYTYMFAFASAPNYEGQARGACLFRSDDPSVRGSWRAWDGNTTNPGFTQPMNNPYISATAPCAVVNPGVAAFNAPLRSVHWHAPSQHYVAIYRDTEKCEDCVPRAFVYYATSTDLIHWNPLQLLMTTSTANGISYPVVLDHDSASSLGTGDYNFDTIYDQGRTYLYYRTRIAQGHTQIKRRLLQVENY
jgi:hypothetical protein